MEINPAAASLGLLQGGNLPLLIHGCAATTRVYFGQSELLPLRVSFFPQHHLLHLGLLNLLLEL